MNAASPSPSPDDAASPEAVLARWRADGEAIRSRLGQAGVARPAEVAGKTGMEVFALMLSGALPYPPIAETLDFQLVEVAHGRAVFQGTPLLRHYNPLGSVHGGWFATLLDSALGCAVHTTLAAGRGYTTAELKVNIVRPLSTRVPLVRAIGEVIHLGRRMATADARLVGPDGKLYAHGSTTCFLFDAADGGA
ncbi:PaaI family thioesterase [Piscinibacter sakaiensis]|nr:PaaI family thioesterase [Piscinibacter sakaiensis]